jgi:hypothetical protein
MNMARFTNSSSSVKWTAFADDELAVLLYPNICRTLADSFTAFGYVNSIPTFTPLQRFGIRTLGSLAMYFAASKVKSKFTFRSIW